jgi:hypothetical protein
MHSDKELKTAGSDLAKRNVRGRRWLATAAAGECAGCGPSPALARPADGSDGPSRQQDGRLHRATELHPQGFSIKRQRTTAAAASARCGE